MSDQARLPRLERMPCGVLEADQLSGGVRISLAWVAR